MIRARGRWGLMTAILLAGTSARAWGEGGSAGIETADARGANPRSDARAQAKAQVKKGQLDYKLARFEEALQDYSRAYELYPAPALLFNLGQCHRNLKNYERAIFFFEGYLRDEPHPANRRLAQELIAESSAELKKQENATSVPQPAPAMLPAPAVAAPVTTAAPRHAAVPAPTQALLVTSPPAPVPEAHRSGTTWWLWAAIAVGVAAAGAFADYETGADRITVPGGTLGTIDRR